MKNTVITLLLLLQTLSAFSREPLYYIKGSYDRGVKKEMLVDAKMIRDFMPGYAKNWITDIISVELLVTNHGKVMKAEGKSETLNMEQKNLLNSVDLFS